MKEPSLQIKPPVRDVCSAKYSSNMGQLREIIGVGKKKKKSFTSAFFIATFVTSTGDIYFAI